MLVQQRHHFFVGRAFMYRDESLLRRHHRRYRRIEIGFEAKVAVRHDADGLLALDDRHAGDLHRLGEVDDLADRHVRRHGNRVAHDAALVFLDQQDLVRLLLDGHVPVNDADAAFLGQRDREPGLGDRVHGRRNERNVELDAGGEVGRQVDFARQHIRVVRLQEYIVERQCFLGDVHWRLLLS